MHTKISPIPLLDTTNLVEWAPALKQTYHRNYYAMYSSLWDGIATAPRDVMLDSERRILDHARRIEVFAVRSDAMPPGNLTEMTGDERQLLAAWLAAGAKAE